jgi:hypothetical protein
MPRDPQAEGALLVLTIKAALAPHLERIAALETENKEFRARLLDMGGLRDRLVAMEVKAAVPVMTTTSVDLGPVLSRLSALEAQEPIPGPPGTNGNDGAVGEPGKPGERGPEGQPGPPGRDGRDGLAGVQGEKGLPGLDGKNGLDGAPGRDGLNGKDGRPGLEWKGAYQEGASYDLGQMVFYAGSSWHCNAPTTSKPDIGSKDWQQMVKRGRDGKDGRDLAPPLPVVKVG